MVQREQRFSAARPDLPKTFGLLFQGDLSVRLKVVKNKKGITLERFVFSL